MNTCKSFISFALEHTVVLHRQSSRSQERYRLPRKHGTKSKCFLHGYSVCKVRHDKQWIFPPDSYYLKL